ncbi:MULTISPECIES: LysE family translocator [Niastella]|uniref:LysE family translocator n=1 Tax=Niastella soli TaxID=2821487 RepID=A0ABS3YP93_9BACT|nr:LysE family translocator [Niastella soli]MBO9199711.1 LysE family translocator [Niastella soli]
MWQAIISGLTLGCILALSVGPVIFTIIKQSINNGHTGGLSFVAGVWLSDIVLVVISNVFSALVATLLAEYSNVIGYLGSAFLFGMGVYYLFFKKVTLRTDADGNAIKFRKRDIFKIMSSGFFLNTLNPSVFIFWLTTASAFQGGSLSQRLITFSVCLALNIAADILKVMLAGKLRSKLTLHNISIINKISGIILGGFGIALFYASFFKIMNH